MIHDDSKRSAAAHNEIVIFILVLMLNDNSHFQSADRSCGLVHNPV